MKTLDIYIIKKFLGTFFYAIALIISIAIVFDAAEKLEDFIIWGGYPGVVLSDNKVEKLTSIFDLFIKKDFKDMLKVENILGAKKIIQYLAINNGKMFTSQNAANFFEYWL